MTFVQNDGRITTAATDMAKVNAMQDANWKPAVQYWREKAERLNDLLAEEEIKGIFLDADVHRLTAECADLRAEKYRQNRVHELNAEALAEIKATVDGKSDQPVKTIVYGLLDEIAAINPDAK